MDGSSDVEWDRVGEVYEYLILVSGKYCDLASREGKRTIRKKALKFSVSDKGELFCRQKGRVKQVPLVRRVYTVGIKKKRYACMYIYTAICKLTIHN